MTGPILDLGRLAAHSPAGKKLAEKLLGAHARHDAARAVGDKAGAHAARDEINTHTAEGINLLGGRGGGGSKAAAGGNAKAKSGLNTSKSKTSGSSSSGGGGGLKSKATVLGTGALLGTALFGGGGEDSPLGAAGRTADRALGRLTGDCHDYVNGGGNGGVIAMDHDVCTELANALEHLAHEIEHDMKHRSKVYDDTVDALRVEGHVPPVYQDFAAALDGMKAKHAKNTRTITHRLRHDAKILHAAVKADIELQRRMAGRVRAIDV